MKYALIALLVAALAGLEFMHVLAAEESPEARVCLAPQTKAAAIRETLLLHLHGH